MKYLIDWLASWFFFRRYYAAKEVSFSAADSAEYALTPKQRFFDLKRGFYMLEANSGVFTSAAIESIIHFDYGDGYNESDGHSFVFKSNRVNKRILWLRDNPTQVSIFTNNACGPQELEIVQFVFARVSFHFAISRMHRKLFSRGEQSFEKKPKCLNALYSRYSDALNLPCTESNYMGWIHSEEYRHWFPVLTEQDIFFSVIIPVFNSRPEWLEVSIRSLLQQTYTHWEVILVDDGSTDESTVKVLGELEKRDKRIRIHQHARNLHICAAQNTGLKLAKGSFCLFLDHDDLLSIHALNECAKVLQDNNKLRFVYSDEDLITDSGARLRPHFKPDWNPELLRAHNYITHLVCIERDLLREMGGFTLGMEGAQDYDLVLRISEKLKEDQIYHIPKVLYHWRMAEGSTAKDSRSKSYATEAGLKALYAHLQRRHQGVMVEYAESENFYKVLWPVPEPSPMVSIIIPTRNGVDVLKPCLDSLMQTIGYTNFEIIVIDNGSDDPEILEYFELIRGHGQIQIHSLDIPFNYSRLNNFGVEKAGGEYLLFLNNDIEAMHYGWLQEMLSLAARPDTGCVGAKLFYPDGTIQHAGVILGLGGYAAHSHRGAEGQASGYFNRLKVRQNMSAVTAACLMLKKSTYMDAGGMDEHFEVAYNDVDLCLKVQQLGYRNTFTPYAQFIHHESKTRGEDSKGAKLARFDREKALLFERWEAIINHDPAYNPNLTRAREDFSI